MPPESVTALLVPFRFGDDPARDRAWRYVRDYYRCVHPRFEVYVGTCAQREPWSKGAAVAQAFKRSREEVVIVADADVVVPAGRLVECVEAVHYGDVPWAQPHARVYRLSATMSAVTMRGPLPMIKELSADRLERRMHVGPRGGGIVVCSRDAFEAVRGIDPRFIGWGGEDISFARALDTLCGPGLHLDAAMWHLWHPRAERRHRNRASEANEALANRYLDAEGDAIAMARLVGEIAW